MDENVDENVDGGRWARDGNAYYVLVKFPLLVMVSFLWFSVLVGNARGVDASARGS